MVIDAILAKHREEWFRKSFRVESSCLIHNTVFLASGEARKEKMQERKDKQTDIQRAQGEEQRQTEAHSMGTEGAVGPVLKYESVTKQFDVAFISADYKYEYFLQLLFKYYDPTLVTNFSVKSEQDMLASIENSRIVLPLLSSNFTFSSKCVDEFNVALARHRKSTTGPVLYPIQLMALPQYPVHFHLVPCNVALQDMLWVEILFESGKFHPRNVSEGLRLAEKQIFEELCVEMTQSDMLAIEAACLDIIALLQKE